MPKYATFDAWFDARRAFSKRAIGPLFCSLALFYLGFHAVSGERGVLALFAETRKLSALKAELAEVVAKREAIDKKVQHMSNAGLDLDLLDEQARAVLGRVGKDEVVYILDNPHP